MWYFEIICAIFIILYVVADEETDIEEYNKARGTIPELDGFRVNITYAPYVAMLVFANDTVRCGATVIHPRFLVTAGNCFLTNGTYYMKVGADTLDGGVKYEIEKIFLHPRYNEDAYRNLFYNDVAIIKVEEPITFSDRVQPITLAPKYYIVESRVALDVFGFGPNMTNHHLLRTDAINIDPEECSNMYNAEITPTMMCTEKMPCTGGAGNPVVLKRILVGIVSRCQEDTPTVLARVSHVRDFIDNTIVDNSELR